MKNIVMTYALRLEHLLTQKLPELTHYQALIRTSPCKYIEQVLDRIWAEKSHLHDDIRQFREQYCLGYEKQTLDQLVENGWNFEEMLLELKYLIEA
ncbi:MAG: hypothetical protein IJW90_05120 [Clostridia bacterium]|nr:hypothetical protein [Clostridia bacterium]MBQ7316477.1 hypothetical protein [Clostridia bacterium]